jgi:hypothetical protein
MKYIKLFENFEPQETEYNKFNGIDISDIKSFDFIWSNEPLIARINISPLLGTTDEFKSEKSISISEQIQRIIDDNNISREQFKELLDKNFNVVPSNYYRHSNWYHVSLKDTEVHLFFELLENIQSYI